MTSLFNIDLDFKFFEIMKKKKRCRTHQIWFSYQTDNNSVASIENSDKATHMWTEVKENHNIKFMS